MYAVDLRTDKIGGYFWDEFSSQIQEVSGSIGHCPVEIQTVQEKEALSKLSREISEMPRLNT